MEPNWREIQEIAMDIGSNDPPFYFQNDESSEAEDIDLFDEVH